MLNKYLTNFPTLTTERLTLRQLAETDATEIFLLRSDLNINQYLDRELSKTLEDALKFINQINANIKNYQSFYWAISNSNNNKLLGTICLFSFSDELHKCEIGFELLADHQGRGIMHEAAKKVIEFASQVINIKKIEAATHKDNQSSIKLLKKLKFQRIESINSERDIFIKFCLNLPT